MVGGEYAAADLVISEGVQVWQLLTKIPGVTYPRRICARASSPPTPVVFC